MTGIELLQMIKNYEIKEGAEINVLRVNEDYCCFDVVAKLKYSDNDLHWSPGTFRSFMLWDNEYLFEISESIKVPNKIEEINFVDEFSDSYYDTCLIKTKDKVNELIKAVNYLLDTHNKG